MEAINLRTQQNEDMIKAIILIEREEMEAAQAKVNAEYLTRIANISTGWKEYEDMLDQARSEDLKRRTEFHEMIDHMRSAGATLEQISSAELEFKKQELGFQSQILKLKQDYAQQRSIYDKDVQEAKVALDMYRAEEKDEALKTLQIERSQSEMEHRVQEAVDKKFKAKADAWKKNNGIVNYQEDLRAAGSNEADKISQFERSIQVMKQKELLHKEQMDQRAKDEVEKAEKRAAETKAEKAGRLQDASGHGNAQLKAKSLPGTDKVLNTLLTSSGAHGKSPVREQELVSAHGKGTSRPGSGKKDPWVDRRAAFFRAMSAQAEATQAKFQTLMNHASPTL